MLEHNGQFFNDHQLRPFGMTKRIANNFYEDECEICVVYGMPEGVGKSGYVNSVLADMYGYVACSDTNLMKYMRHPKPLLRESDPILNIWECDFEKVKDFIFYPPREVVDTCMRMLEKQIRQPAFHWDDAGTWLNAMSWHDPFVSSFMEYLSLARSNWGMVVLSTPVEEWVLKKLRTATGILHARITKTAGASHVWKPRLCKAHKAENYLGGRKTYYPIQWEDKFVAMMPDSFYKWYKPKRDSYALMAVKKMRKALNRKKAGDNKLEQIEAERDEAILQSIIEVIDPEEEIAKANDKSKDFNELIGVVKDDQENFSKR